MTMACRYAFYAALRFVLQAVASAEWLAINSLPSVGSYGRGWPDQDIAQTLFRIYRDNASSHFHFAAHQLPIQRQGDFGGTCEIERMRSSCKPRTDFGESAANRGADDLVQLTLVLLRVETAVEGCFLDHAVVSLLSNSSLFTCHTTVGGVARH